VQLFQQLFRFAGTDHPGIYSLAARGATVQQFVVNLDPRESQTVKATEQRTEDLAGSVGIQRSSLQYVDSAEELKQGVLQSRFGVELWKYFVTLALIIAILELLVARTWKRELGVVAHHD
jgi:hypothetical protein